MYTLKQTTSDLMRQLEIKRRFQIGGCEHEPMCDSSESHESRELWTEMAGEAYLERLREERG